MSISDVFSSGSYSTDKYDLGYIDGFYDWFLKKYERTPITFLEIGVASGGSTRLWKDYFYKGSKIFAGDITPFNHIEGVESIFGDMYSLDKALKFPDECFDLIIDDGPHSEESFILLMERYFPKLKTGGNIVIEDIIVSELVPNLVEFAEICDYSKCQVIDMTGKQKTKNLLDTWKNGLYIICLTK